MKTHAWLVILGLGPFAPGCWADRPLYVATTPDAPSPSGAAGAAAGTGGPAGQPGTTGAGGTTSTAVVGGCDAVPILRKSNCYIAGCHDAQGASANLSLSALNLFDQSGVDWRAKLVGVYPKGGGVLPSQCFPSQFPYLVPGSLPARGLLIDKLFARETPCGDSMPLLGVPLSGADADCIMSWANELTTAPGGGGSGAAGTTGAAGGGGHAGVGLPGCPQAIPILQSRGCHVVGACHDSTGSAAGFSLELDQLDVDWKAKLVGVFPKGGTRPPGLQSMCFPSQEPYLIAGSYPARGLFLDKLGGNPQCGALMPLIGSALTAGELDCVQRWADKLTAR